MEHCCKQMEFWLEEGKVEISYSPICREYHINLNKYPDIGQRMIYCAWCGIKLPESLRDTMFDIIFDELNLDSYEDPRLPKEFRSDEWWKKRGL